MKLTKDTEKRFRKIGFGNQAMIVGTKRVELLDFITTEISLAVKAERERIINKLGDCPRIVVKEQKYYKKSNVLNTVLDTNEF